MKLDPSLRIFITGKTQSGKTHWARDYLAKCRNILVYDLKRQYGDLGAVVQNLAQMQDAFVSGCNRVVYQPIDISPEHFDAVCGWILNNLTNIVFCVDEVHKFCPKFKIPPNFNTLVTVCQGTPYCIGIVAITQRTANVHNDVLSQSSVWVVFRLSLPADAQAVEDFTGIKVEEIKGLPFRNYFTFCDFLDEKQIEQHPPL